MKKLIRMANLIYIILTKGGSSYKKPAVPPKPRNVVVKPRSSTKLRKSGEILNKKTNVLLEDEKSEQNDSGLSGKKFLFFVCYLLQKNF